MRPSKLIMCATMSILVWTWLVGLFAPSVTADDALVKFKGRIGVMPVSIGVGIRLYAELLAGTIIQAVGERNRQRKGR
jgi:hypothetical protein